MLRACPASAGRFQTKSKKARTDVTEDSIKASIRKAFKRSLILSGGYDAARAESDLAAGKCDLVAFGRPALANPDLVKRLQTGAALNSPDVDTFYTPGPAGYTDYPTLQGSSE